MNVMETQQPVSSLPIYHRSVDWDALYRRYPVPDVFEKTRWRWSADQIRAFQNEQFLDLMKTGWQNGFYQRRWKAAGIEPGDIRSIDDIGKLPTFDSDDIKKDQQENPPFGLINGDVRGQLDAPAGQGADLGRHHRQAASDHVRPDRMGDERSHHGARALHLRHAAGRHHPDPAHLLARQCRLVRLQGLARLSRRAAAHHRHRRGDELAPPDRDRDGVGHQCLVRAPGILHAAGQGGARGAEFRSARSAHQVPRLRSRARYRPRIRPADRGVVGLPGLRHVRHPRDGHGLVRMPAPRRHALHGGLHLFRDRRRREREAGSRRHRRQHGVHHPAPPHHADDPLQSARPHLQC